MARLKIGFCFAFFVFLSSQLIDNVQTSCVSCPSVSPDEYNVHIVPHSHMDLGWLKTVEQYYYGTNAQQGNYAVQYIYDSVLLELLKNPARRFIAVETGFFQMWWKHKDATTKNQFLNVLQNGQLEFISGGIVMNDEAAAHYENIIDQMSYGLQTLDNLFGACGRVETGWQIDPFGHSKQYALILSKMGFKQLFYGRMDDQEKSTRQQNRTMEFKWQLDDTASINVGVLPTMYFNPSGFCFDYMCSDIVLVTDEKSPEYNVQSRSEEFLRFVQSTSASYASNNLIVTMGGDFRYQNALKSFSNLDILIDFINSHNYTINFNGRQLRVNIVYSTPTCYARSSFPSQNLTTNQADFFPYSYPDVHSFWTGYFTSRPTFKYLVRTTTALYHSAIQMFSDLRVTGNIIDSLRYILSVCQHHDAITGTAKQYVNDNYIKLVSKAVSDAVTTLSIYTGNLGHLQYCHQLNVSKCGPTENLTADGTPVSLYNPLAFGITHFLRLPVSDTNLNISDENGNLLNASFVPISQAVINLAERNSNSRYELIVPIDINGTGYRFLQLKSSPKDARAEVQTKIHQAVGKSVIRTKRLKIGFNNGAFEHINIKGKQVKLSQSFSYYESSCDKIRASGAYIFRPASEKKVLTLQNTTQISTPHFTEYQQIYSNGVSQNVRVYNDKPFIELDWIIGPIDVSDKIGKEFVTSIDTDLVSNDVFYTDSNGRDSLKRVRNQRDNWKLNLSEPISGNYYPINSRISLTDGKNSVTVLTDRAQGASSLTSGSVEVMLHRRCLCDDGFGVGEPLNEPGVDGKGLQVRGTLRLYVGDESVGRKEDLQMSNPPMILFSELLEPREQVLNLGSLGDSVHLLTFKSLSRQSYLVRLENLEDKPISVQLSKLFSKQISTAKEVDLSSLNTLNDQVDVVTLSQHDIKTFVIELNF